MAKGKPPERAKYLTGKPANDVGGIVLATTAELQEIIANAVIVAVAEALESWQGAASALLDSHGLARELKCGPGLVDKMRRGGMPCLYLGDSPRFELPVCIDWARANGKQP